VGFAIGAAYLCGLLLHGVLSWLAAGFVSGLVFIFLEGLELAIADASEEED
jgi:hypothetical protein